MSLQPYIIQVMESMGWNNGSNIPIASADNQALLDQINELTKAKGDKQTIVQYYKLRQDKTQGHYDSAVTEFEQNLKLVHAYQSQLTSEHHLYKVAEGEVSQFKQDLKRVVKDQAELDRYDGCAKSE
jgi:hypothetical protein